MAQCVLLYGNSEFPVSPKSSGPFRIATELRKNNFSVQCIDITAFSPLNRHLFLKVLEKVIGEETLWVGISSSFLWGLFGLRYNRMIGSYDLLKAENKINEDGIQGFVKFVKKLNPKIKLLHGGSRNFEVERYGFVQFEGYVDTEILNYTKWLNKEKAPINLDFYSNKIKGSEFKDFVTSNVQFDHSDIILPGDTLPTEIARGCIFKCKFCSYPLNGKTKGEWVKRPEALLEDLIKNYEMFGTTSYTFSDETYNDSIDKIRSLRDNVFSKLPFKLRFTAYLRLDLIMRFPESIDILAESGLKSAIFGIETMDPGNAKLIGKGVDPWKQIDFIRQLKSDKWKDILVSTGYILGLPNDTPDSINKLEEWLFSEDNPLDHWQMSPLSIVPRGVTKSIYYSEFDENYEKYGYSVTINPKDTGRTQIYWENKKQGLDYAHCITRGNEIMKRSRLESDRYKYGSWMYPFYSSFFTDEQILSTPIKDLEKQYNIKSLSDQRVIAYQTELLRQLGLTDGKT